MEWPDDVTGVAKGTAIIRRDINRLADVLIDLGNLALAFGRIDRTAVYHPDGETPESDTDHTVMLGWLACALAAGYFPELDLGLVAQFALVHDAPEVYAGDTQTLRITDAGRAAKAAREHAAIERITEEFQALPWFPRLIALYEAQELAEARFVRGLDKVLPKIVHLLDGCAGLREFDITPTELNGTFERQQVDMAGYVGEFEVLMDLRAELVRRVVFELTRLMVTGETPA
jgi:putative hydrolase of HD superfamily